jgi:DNA-binding LacI/PurR family transcriptional regulator
MKGLVKTKAEEMNYHPNVLARNLSSRKSGVIGVIVPEFETGFFPRVILGIQDTLAKEGYRILITQSGESAQKERENLELLLGNMVEGIIVSVAKEGGNDDAFR